MQISMKRIKNAISLMTVNAISGFRIHPRRKSKILVENDHLEPHYFRGDVLKMDPAILPRPGDIVLARDPDGSLHLGHFKSDDGQGLITAPRPVRRGAMPRVIAVHRPN